MHVRCCSDASADLVDESKTEPSLESLSKLKGSVLSSVADTASVHTQLGQPKTFLAVDSAFARGTGYTTDWLFPTDHSVVRACSLPPAGVQPAHSAACDVLCVLMMVRFAW